MSSDSLVAGSEALTLVAHSRHLKLRTRMRHQFIDLTEAAAEGTVRTAER